MNIVQLTPTPMASVPYRYAQLINKYTHHKCTYIQGRSLFIGHSSDIPIGPQIQKEIWDADIIHVHGHRVFDTKSIEGIKFKIHPRTKIFLEYHGVPERGNPRFYRTNVHMIVSTPEMLKTFPKATYFPALIDEREILPKSISVGNPFKVCQLWSYHTKLKDFDVFDNVQKYFEERPGDKIKLIRFPQMTAGTVIDAMQNFDCIFDHLQGYYGVISIEGMALGKVVINGATPEVIRKIMQALESPTPPPFLIVNRNNIIEQLIKLSYDQDNIKMIMARSREYIERYWAGSKMINKLIKIYEEG